MGMDEAGAQAVVLPAGERVVEGFRPRSVRVHPLSRWEAAGDDGAGRGALGRASATLIVHVELLDAGSQGVKWPGVLGVVIDPDGDDVGQWWLDLTDPAANAASWDAVTRTYVLRRSVPTSWAGAEVEVVWFQGAPSAAWRVEGGTSVTGVGVTGVGVTGVGVASRVRGVPGVREEMSGAWRLPARIGSAVR